VSRVDLPDQRSDDEVDKAGEPENKPAGNFVEKAGNLPPSHPSSPAYRPDGERPTRTSGSSDSLTVHDPADQGQDQSTADDSVTTVRPTDAESSTPDDEHAERDTFVAAALADAHKAGLATDHEQVIDAKRRIWAPERAELHGEIVRDLYAKANAVPCDGKAILAGGLPGAGKSSVLNGVASIDLRNYLTINPDDIKEEMARRGMIPEIDGLSPMEASDLAHEESSDMAKRLALRAYSDNKNVIWDVTMSSAESTQGRIADLRSAGYAEIEGIFVDIPVEVSVRRAEARHREGHDQYEAGQGLGGRYIPPDRIRSLADPDYGSVNRAAFEQVKPEFSRWRIFDNSADGCPAKLAEDSTRQDDDPEEGR
jgi:predicted kinase